MSVVKLKFTPLSIVIAVCFTYALCLLLGLVVTDETGISASTKAIFTFILAIILFLADLLFRRFIENTKWLWLIQGAFILIIIILILIFQKI
jgi:hypothetical protein